MKYQISLLFGLCFMSTVAMAIPYPPPEESFDDLWNFDSGNFGAASASSQKFGPVDRVFGNHFQPPAAFPDFGFADNLPQGTAHQISWSLNSAITLRSFSMFAAHDANKTGRGLREFRLFANDLNDGNIEKLLFDYDSGPGLSYALSPDNLWTDNQFGLHLAANVGPVLATNFRAVFTQFGQPTPVNSGTRVIELDGFDTFLQTSSSAPEPATNLLLALAISGLALGSRTRRSNG